MKFKRLKAKLFLTTVFSTLCAAPVLASANVAAEVYSQNTAAVQTILSKLGYLPAAQINGYIDETTRNAVAGFQQSVSLPVDGVIDGNTANALNAAYQNLATQPVPAQFAPAPAAGNALSIQQVLQELGLKVQLTGVMDAQTREAIASFQARIGLPADGRVDEATAKALNEAYVKGAAAFAKQASGLETGFGPALLSSSSLLWTGAAGAAAAGGAIAAGGGGGGASGGPGVLDLTPIDFGIASNDAGDQAYNGTFVAANLDNPASGTPANFLLGDAAVADSLPLMNAQFAQARGYDGRVYHRSPTGALLNTTFDDYVVVAVFDSGIDFAHPDLDGNVLADDSVTCAGGVCVRGGEDADGHGTNVAGLIAAEDNTIGTVGVAPQAKLLSVAVPDLLTADITAGYSYLNNKAVDVVNNSFGSDFALVTPTQGSQDGILTAAQLRSSLTTSSGGTTWLAEIEQAVSQHSILVWAAGNEGSDQPTAEASMPYYFNGTVNVANVEDYNWTNNWVSVVSVNDSLALSSFSNQCGISEDYCLAAPGEIYTTELGGTYGNTQGTSFSAPNVSGALAVLLGAYPHLSPEQVLNVLFETATDLGVAGTDVVFGRGLVNLDAATNPTGNSADWTLALSGASFSSLGTQSSSFSSSGLNLSSAFGDAISRNTQNIMFVDSLGKDYQTPISSLLQVSTDGKSNETRLAEFGRGGFASNIALSEKSKLSYSLSAQQDDRLLNEFTATSKHDTNKFLFSQNFSTSSKQQAPELSASFGYNVNAAEMIGFAAFAEGEEAGLQVSDAFKNPYLSMTEFANGVSVGYQVGNFGVRYAGYEAKDQRDEYEFSEGNKTSGNLAEVYFASGDEFGISFQTGSASETNTFLGSEAGGALELDSESPTYFAGVAASYSPFDNFAIKANYNSGLTKLDSAEDSLIKDISDVRSSSFAVGVEMANLQNDSDKFGLSFGQPLRINSASAALNLPEDVAADGTILYQDSQLQLAPLGRELNLEAYYDMMLASGSQLSLGSMLRLEPNNVQEASDEGLLLMKYKTNF